jgi:AcrR family transcriptional regulator
VIEREAALQDAFIGALRGDAGPLPPGPHAQPRDEITAAHRRRVIAGMTQALAAKGLARTTIADVVREAQVSRRTFYELFDDKISCLLATYDAVWDETMRYVEAAVAPVEDRTWQERARAGVRTYLRLMDAMPGLARVFIVELPASGPEAQRHVRAVHQRFATLITRVAEEQRADLPDDLAVDALIATAIVGGVNEIVLQALATGDRPFTPERERAAMRLLVGALQPLPADMPSA